MLVPGRTVPQIPRAQPCSCDFPLDDRAVRTPGQTARQAGPQANTQAARSVSGGAVSVGEQSLTSGHGATVNDQEDTDTYTCLAAYIWPVSAVPSLT